MSLSTATPTATPVHDLLQPKVRRRTRIGLVAGGLGTYWPQFPGLLPQLQESARYVSERFREMDAEVTDVGFVSDAREGAAVAEQLRRADCDLIVLFLTTYLTSSMVLPIAQRSNTPVLVIDLQPTEKMDHASFDTGAWLAYCGQCPVPEVGNVVPPGGHPLPVGIGVAAPGVSVAADRPVDSGGARARGAAARAARADGAPLPRNARRLHRPDTAAGHVRLARGGAGVRRPAAPRREGHRRRGRRARRPRPAGLHPGRLCSRRRLRLGREGVGRSGWTGSPTTSPSTRWPTTTAAWTGSSTSGLARG